MTYQPIDWLSSWMNKRPQRTVASNWQKKGLSPAVIGATQIRFMIHALGERFEGLALSALADPDSGEYLPIIIDKARGIAQAYPGAREVTPGAEVLADPRAQLEHFPGADPRLFQHYMDRAAQCLSFQDFYKAVHDHSFPEVRPDAQWFDGSRRLNKIREAMDWFYGCDEAIGVRMDPRTEESVLPNGSTFSRCTNSAHMMAGKFGGTVSGFMVDDNPEVSEDAIRDAGGHDFAVINNRYVVDLWIGVYTGRRYEDGKQYPSVYDLASEDPREQKMNRALYGERGNWSILEDYARLNTDFLGEKNMSAALTIDLVPYKVEIEKDRHLIIQECGGSVLGNLNNDPDVTGNRFSDELQYAVLETEDGDLRPYRVEYHAEDGGTLIFSPRDEGKPSLDEVERWVSDNYDRMQSIEYEALLDNDELESAMGRHRASMSPG